MIKYRYTLKDLPDETNLNKEWQTHTNFDNQHLDFSIIICDLREKEEDYRAPSVLHSKLESLITTISLFKYENYFNLAFYSNPYYISVKDFTRVEKNKDILYSGNILIAPVKDSTGYDYCSIDFKNTVFPNIFLSMVVKTVKYHFKQ